MGFNPGAARIVGDARKPYQALVEKNNDDQRLIVCSEADGIFPSFRGHVGCPDGMLRLILI